MKISDEMNALIERVRQKEFRSGYPAGFQQCAQAAARGAPETTLFRRFSRLLQCKRWPRGEAPAWPYLRQKLREEGKAP